MAEKSGRMILVVDDDSDNIDLLSRLLTGSGYDVISASNGVEALREVEKNFFHVILLDIRMPGMDGIEVLEKLKEESPQSMVILLTAYGSEENNIKKALDIGIYDLIDKPVDNRLLLHKIKRAFIHADVLLRNEQAKKEELVRYPYENIVGKHPKMGEIFTVIQKVAPADACVLITGETGTGKELVGRAIHAIGKRSGQPFIAINAGALPETLLEAELFGHEKGAFTGAEARRFGYFESCKGGTIFLDEIGDISANVQVKLLRVLQEREITRLGSSEPIQVDVRVITATNKDLEKLIAKGTFRQDLYYRIKTVALHLPPLRERRDDIPLLVEHFIKKFSGREVKVSEEALEVLMEYDYPGNIRELEHAVERALIFQEGEVIRPGDLPPEFRGRGRVTEFSELFGLVWEEAKARVERMYIEAVLERAGGNVSEASRMSGIDRSYLHKQMKKYDIKR